MNFDSESSQYNLAEEEPHATYQSNASMVKRSEYGSRISPKKIEIEKLSSEMRHRNDVFKMVRKEVREISTNNSETIGDSSIGQKMLELIRKEKMMEKVIEQFKKMSQINIHELEDLHTFLL